jgi:YHS domain-containing protein
MGIFYPPETYLTHQNREFFLHLPPLFWKIKFFNTGYYFYFKLYQDVKLPYHQVAQHLHFQSDTIRKYKHGGYPMHLSAKNKKTVVDPVCGMAVVPGAKEIVASIDGETYYFCAKGCRQSFEENPQKFLNPKPAKRKGLWGRYLERLEKTTGGKSINCH